MAKTKEMIFYIKEQLEEPKINNSYSKFLTCYKIEMEIAINVMFQWEKGVVTLFYNLN